MTQLLDFLAKTRLLWLITPAAGWLFFFFLVPLFIILVYSFLERNQYGGVIANFTLENYHNVLNPVFLKIILYSLWIAIITTVICLVIGYPVAYYISTRRKPSVKNSLILLVILPFWTNFLVRTYAWLIILREGGLINTFLMQLGLIDTPIKLLFTKFAVIVGLVYGYLPFMILPLYASMEKIEKSMIEAAYDLGANRLQVLWRILIPLTAPGIFAGSIMVFIPTLGAYITPDLLGGAKNMMIGNLIQHQFLKMRNWPFGSSLSLIILAMVLIFLLFYIKLNEAEQKRSEIRVKVNA
jgi:spermidine/putrescine transport system permease protein